jgi:hypothetical protein
MPSFLIQGNSFFPVSVTPSVQTPTSGATVQMRASQPNLFVANVSTLAALTVRLPPASYSGQMASITSQSVITALTVQNNLGVAVAGAPTTNAAGTIINFTWVNGVWQWLKPATLAAP